MHDDELRRQMRALDADFAPDPHFADSLFTQLTVEARGGRTGSGRLVLLLAAALLIVALGAGVVLGSGMLKLPLVADESGSPVPSPSPIASPGEPTPSSAPDSAAPSPTVLPEIALRPGLLPPGSIVSVTGDGLRLRSAPSLSAEIITSMRAGEQLLIDRGITVGPVEREGYEWYQVEYPADAADSNRGWVAAGQADQRFLQLAEVTCTGEPLTIDSIQAMSPWERLVCLRGAAITLEGTYGCSGCGGTSIGLEPAWLTWQGALLRAGQGTQSLTFHVPPSFELPADGSIVRATFHLDDPAAATCSVSIASDGTAWTDSQEGPQLFCREQLVIDSIEVLGTDPNWPY